MFLLGRCKKPEAGLAYTPCVPRSLATHVRCPFVCQPGLHHVGSGGVMALDHVRRSRRRDHRPGLSGSRRQYRSHFDAYPTSAYPGQGRLGLLNVICMMSGSLIIFLAQTFWDRPVRFQPPMIETLTPSNENTAVVLALMHKSGLCEG